MAPVFQDYGQTNQVVVVCDDIATDAPDEIFRQRVYEYCGSIDKQKLASKANTSFRQLLQMVSEELGLKYVHIPSIRMHSLFNPEVDLFYKSNICVVDMTMECHSTLMIYHNTVRSENNNISTIFTKFTDSGETITDKEILFYGFDSDKNVCFSYETETQDDWQNSSVVLRDTIRQEIVSRRNEVIGHINKMLTERLRKFEQMPNFKDGSQFEQSRLVADIWREVGEPALTVYRKSITREFVSRLLSTFRDIHDYASLVRVDHFLRQSKQLQELCCNDNLIQYLLAFGYSRCGDADNRREALRILNSAYVDQTELTDYHTLCLYGQIHKDMYLEDELVENRNQAIKYYQKSFELNPSIYAGINLLLLYVASGLTRESGELVDVAVQLATLLGKKGDIRYSRNYWHLASAFVYYVIVFKFHVASEIALYIHMLNPPVWCLQSVIADINLYWRYLNQLQLSGKFKNKNRKNKNILDFWLDFFTDAITRIEKDSVLETESDTDSCDGLQTNKGLIPVLLDTRTNVCHSDRNKLAADIHDIRREKPECKFFELYINVSGVADDDSHIAIDCIQNSKGNIILPCNMILSIVRAFDPRALFLYTVSDMDNYKLCFSCPQSCEYFFTLINQSRKALVNPKFCIGRRDSLKSLSVNYSYETDIKGRPIHLGQGSYGSVYLARDADNPLLKYAVKVINVKLRKPILETFQNEIHILSLLKHKHIVRYYGSNLDMASAKDGFAKLSIILEYVEGGTLSHYLSRYGPFKEKLIQTYLRQILIGVEYLHSNRIMHRDIKGSNILINRYNGELKIADFGTCTRLVGCLSSSIEDGMGTVQYMAPDVIRISNKGYGLPADIWSVGCTVIEMSTGEPPYPDEENRYSLFLRIGNYSSHPSVPENLSDNLKHLLNCCFLPDPDARLTASELLKHPFFDADRDLFKLRSHPRIRSYHDSLRKNADFSRRSICESLRRTTPASIIGESYDEESNACKTSRQLLSTSWLDKFLIDTIRTESVECIRTYNKFCRDPTLDAFATERVLMTIDNLLSVLRAQAPLIKDSFSSCETNDETKTPLSNQGRNNSSLELLVPAIMHVMIRKHRKSLPLSVVTRIECLIKQVIELIALTNFYMTPTTPVQRSGVSVKPLHNTLSVHDTYRDSVDKACSPPPSPQYPYVSPSLSFPNEPVTTNHPCMPPSPIPYQSGISTNTALYVSSRERALANENSMLVEELIATHRKYLLFLQSYIDLIKRTDKAVKLVKEFQKRMHG